MQQTDRREAHDPQSTERRLLNKIRHPPPPRGAPLPRPCTGDGEGKSGDVGEGVVAKWLLKRASHLRGTLCLSPSPSPSPLPPRGIYGCSDYQSLYCTPCNITHAHTYTNQTLGRLRASPPLFHFELGSLRINAGGGGGQSRAEGLRPH